MACAVRRDGARSLSAARGGAVHRARTPCRGEPRTGRGERERRLAAERRALSMGGVKLFVGEQSEEDFALVPDDAHKRLRLWCFCPFHIGVGDDDGLYW